MLAYYPTLWAYDVFDQVPHLIGKRINTHHPIIHTLFIESFMILGHKIKNYTLGMLLLSIVQMSIMSCIFAYSIEKVKSLSKNKLLRKLITIILIIYYGIVPFNSIMSISMTKDVLFSGMLLLLITYIFDLVEGKEFSKKKNILFIITSILCILIKNNMLYVYILFLFSFIIFYKLKNKFKILFSCIIAITISSIINTTLPIMFNALSYSSGNSKIVQNQTLIYTAIKHPKTLINDKGYLYDYIPLKCFDNDLPYYYDKNRADLTRDSLLFCENFTIDDSRYMKIWIKYGLKYPVDYIDAWGNLTIGSWYLLDESHANTYPGYNQGYLLSDYKIIPGISDERPKSKFPALYNLLEEIATENVQYEKISIFRFIFEPATYVLSFFLLIVYIIKNKYREYLIPLSLLLGIYLFLLVAPVILVRYVYPFMVCVPIIFFRLLVKKREAN